MRRVAVSTRGLVVSLLGAALGVACLVKDVELVERLPGDGRAGDSGSSGSSSTAGTQNEGGEDAAGGDGSSGGSSQTGGTPSGGKNMGGSAGNNPGGSAGSDPGGGSGGSGGSSGNSPTEIPDPLLTCGDPNYYVCDDFESTLAPQWAPGMLASTSPDAPSGTHVLLSEFQAQMLSVDLQAMSISFWVRVDGSYDQRIVSFRNEETLEYFGLGIEEARARWLHTDAGGVPVVAAPSADNKTRQLQPNTWFCVELRADHLGGAYESRVVVPGDPPFTLPILDHNPTTGEDDTWNASFPDWRATAAFVTFGQDGAYQEYDDVLVADYDVQTLCEAFLASD